MRISKRKFDEQVASFRQHRAVDDIGARIIVAAGQVIVGRHERNGLTDYHVTIDDIADFLDGLDRAHMRFAP
jgi:hypothetical protein